MLNKRRKLIIVCLVLGILLLLGCRDYENVIKNKKVKGQGQIKVIANSGRKVKLKAIPKDDWRFVQWKGSLTSGKNPQTIVLEEGMTIAAEFKYNGPDIKGKGTRESPFIIYTLAGLGKIGTEGYPLDAYYKLGKNIEADLTNDKAYNQGRGWNPIGEIHNLNKQ